VVIPLLAISCGGDQCRADAHSNTRELFVQALETGTLDSHIRSLAAQQHLVDSHQLLPPEIASLHRKLGHLIAKDDASPTTTTQEATSQVLPPAALPLLLVADTGGGGGVYDYQL
jgi:hypothetical protein